MKLTSTFLVLALSVLLFGSCASIQPGEVAVKQRFGKFVGDPKTQGIIGYNPFTTKVIRTSVRKTNLLLDLKLPSKEGLSVDASISIIYHVDQERYRDLLINYGLDFEPIITAIFRSASSDVCARFFAKDMHSGKRADIERAIKVEMDSNLYESGIIIDAVLMKSITLPERLAGSIEMKLQAEQDAMRMDFVLTQEKKEAERKIIEAEGKRRSQLIMAEGLTDKILYLKSIEAFELLAGSSNTKIIVTNGKLPFLIEPESEQK